MPVWPPSTMQGADYPPFPMWPWTGNPTSAPGSRRPPPFLPLVYRGAGPPHGCARRARSEPNLPGRSTGPARARDFGAVGVRLPAVLCFRLCGGSPFAFIGFLPALAHGWLKTRGYGYPRPQPCPARAVASFCCGPGSLGTAAVNACGVKQPRSGGGFRVTVLPRGRSLWPHEVRGGCDGVGICAQGYS